MPLRLCPTDPLLDLARRRFEGLNVLGTPTPSLRPLTVVALHRRGDPIELGALSAMVEDDAALSAEPPIEEEQLPDLAGQRSRRFGLDLASHLLPGVLGAFGADAGLVARSSASAEFSLSFGGVRALRVDRARLGRALSDLRLSARHPHTALLSEPDIRFAIVDRVIVADEVDVHLHDATRAQLSAAAPDPHGLVGLSGGLSAERDQAQRIRSRAAAPVVLAWSCLVYRVGVDGRIGALRGEIRQMDDADASGERASAWGPDVAGRLRSPGEQTPSAPVEHLGVVDLLAAGEILFRTEGLRPSEVEVGGEVRQYGPTYTGGPADLKIGSDRIGVCFTAPPSNGVVSEDQLLLRRSSGSTYPPIAPLTGDGTRSAVSVAQSGAGFDSRADFLDDAWNELSPGGNDTVYHVRANARRYTVTDVGLLSSALSNAQGSQWVDKLVERNSSNQVVNTGWVYVEVLAYDGTIHRRVHQFTPSGMVLPPTSNTLALEPGTGMSLSSLVSTYVSSGWKYAVANVDASVVQGGPLTASPPAAPDLWGSSEGVGTA